MRDEATYPVALGMEPDGKPVISMLRRNQFPPWLHSNKYNKWFLNRPHMSTGWRCMVTGVQCHAAPKSFYDGNHRNMPWALTIDHLVPTMLRDGDEMADRLLNQAVVGWYVNFKMGHIPLAVKLLHRNTFRAMRFGERPPTRDTCVEARSVIIANEDSLRLGGLYPWQPWTYPEGSHRVEALAFMGRMGEFHARFLSVSPNDRAAFLDAFEWIW